MSEVINVKAGEWPWPLHLRLWHDPLRDCFALAATSYDTPSEPKKVKRYYVSGLELTEFQVYGPIQEFITVAKEGPGNWGNDLQDIMNELWQHGIRPAEGLVSTGERAAMKEHLADLRYAVTKLLERP